jgi:hypothetical protein
MDALIEGYSASPKGQMEHLIDLMKVVLERGGESVIY